jgi:hypothetical protein
MVSVHRSVATTSAPAALSASLHALQVPASPKRPESTRREQLDSRCCTRPYWSGT